MAVASCSSTRTELELEIFEEDKRWYEFGNAVGKKVTDEINQIPTPTSRLKYVTKKKYMRGSLYGSVCSYEEFSVTKHVMGLVSLPCATSYLLCDIDYVSAMNEFKRFLLFIQGYSEPGHVQLYNLIFPVFVYFYVHLVEKNPFTARLFFHNNVRVFDDASHYQRKLQELFCLRSVEEIKKHLFFKEFLSEKEKTTIVINEDVLKDLRNFLLYDLESEALLYVLHFHFHFHDGTFHQSAYDGIHGGYFFREIDMPSQSNTDHDEELAKMTHELYLNSPRILSVFAACQKSRFCSVDFNEAESQIAFAIPGKIIYFSQLIEVKEPELKRSSHTHSSTDVEVPKKKRRGKGGGGVCERTKIRKRKRPQRPAKDSTNKSNEKVEKEKGDAGTEKGRNMIKVEIPEGESAYVVKFVPGHPNYILAACDRTVRVYNTETGTFESLYVHEHTSYIKDMDINSTSEYFATASLDMTSCLFRFDQGTVLRKFVGHQAGLTKVKFHPHGLYLATGSLDAIVRLYDTENALCLRSFIDHKFEISSLAFSPDGCLLATADTAGIVKTWDLKQGTEISEVCFTRRFKTKCSQITSLAFHCNSTLIAACDLRGVMKFWDVRKIVIPLSTTREHPEPSASGAEDPSQMLALSKRQSRKVSTKLFKNTPVLIKFNKTGGYWTTVFKENVVYKKKSV